MRAERPEPAPAAAKPTYDRSTPARHLYTVRGALLPTAPTNAAFRPTTTGQAFSVARRAVQA